MNIKETTEILMQASKELCNLIIEHNARLQSEITSQTETEPDYMDYQTCQELQVIARDLKKLEDVDFSTL